jgi:hypothetical protein
VDGAAAACVSTAVGRWNVPSAAIRGSGLGRVTVMLRSTDLLARRETARASRSTHGRSRRSHR